MASDQEAPSRDGVRRQEMARAAIAAAEAMAAAEWRFQGEEAVKALDPQVRSALWLAIFHARPPPLGSAEEEEAAGDAGQDVSWGDHFARNRANSTAGLLHAVARWLQLEEGFLALGA